MNPNFFEARYNLALALAGEGRAAEAADQFERAIALRPGFPATHYNLGMALRAMGREADADVEFRKAGSLGFRP
jgi:Flp pilus assembly protein TadD